jgi:hypothetical protein
MSLDNIIVVVLVLGVVVALVALNLHSRRKEKLEKSKPAGEE